MAARIGTPERQGRNLFRPIGTLVASLANLIAYRIYARSEGARPGGFLVKFHLASGAALLAGVLLYFLLASQ